MSRSRGQKLTQGTVAAIALLFGLLTLFAGTRVLLGYSPGYKVFQPLLIFNTSMGFVYIVAGVIAWRSLVQGKRMAAVVVLLNLLVLGFIGYLYVFTHAIAVESLAAMVFRSLLWLVLFLGLMFASKKPGDRDRQTAIPRTCYPSIAAGM